MNAWRGGAVGVALAGLITLVATRLQDILTNAFLTWALIATGAVLVSLAFSWGWTQAYKRVFIDVDLDMPPDTTGMSSTAEMAAARNAWAVQVHRAKRLIYMHAMGSCLLPSLVLGVVLLLAQLDHTRMLVFAVLWVVGSFALCGLSPFLWKVVFEVALPWLMSSQGKKP